MKTWLVTIWKGNKTFFIFVGLMFVFRSAVADWNEVPTGSMKPTLIEGDRILVDKMAYDLRIPFTHISLHKFSDPKRGDIVIFDSSVFDKRLVKRVVGVPGDKVSLVNNKLSINGKEAEYSVRVNHAGAIDLNEVLTDMHHLIRVSKASHPKSQFLEVVVPEGHYLVLGDNRNNSADSRVIGFVPRHEIVGKSDLVVMSLNYDNHYMPRKERFLHTLN